ncbi:MAG: PqqD family protein [Alphaproteobacteria bacterium]|nr:PqqD family protein [Alphaproteobacteria bacterium]
MSAPRYRVAEGVASTDVDGEVTILDPRSGLYFGLEDVGADIWVLLAEARSVAEVCDALLERYDVDRSECAADVQGLVDELVGRRLVEVLPGA